MENPKENLCGLCLNIIVDEKYEIIGEITRGILNFLLLKLHLDEKEQHLMCSNCSIKLFAAYDFKSSCMDIEDSILAYGGSGENALMDLRDVYLKLKESKQLLKVEDDQKICRLCLEIADGYVWLADTHDPDIVRKYIPEVDFSATENPIICNQCFDAVNTHNAFLMGCKDAEERMKRTCENNATVSHSYIKNEEIDIKADENNHPERDDITLHSLLNESVKVPEPYLISKDEVLQKINYTHQYGSKLKCGLCGYETRYRHVLRRHALDHDIFTFENELYKCRLCDYTAKKLTNLKRHMRVHKGSSENSRYECSACGYRSEYKRSMDIHSLMHKDASEVRSHDCELCDFKTKYRNNLKVHMLLHKDPASLKTFQCDKCDFKTRYKKCWTYHLLNHADSSEVEILKCDTCSYETKHKSNLAQHVAHHKDAASQKLYKCSLCDYVTRYKQKFVMHMDKYREKHANIHRCNICGYASMWVYKVMDHMLVHKDGAQVKMYKCDKCVYETTQKQDLPTHYQLVHKDRPEVTMHKCGQCGYETTRKGNLKKHELKHRSNVEAKTKESAQRKTYKCTLCDYECEWKNYLTSHMWRHKDANVKMYQCEECNYETKFKCNLMSHRLKHVDPSEIKMYKCNLCSYATKFKYVFKQHKDKHEKLL